MIAEEVSKTDEKIDNINEASREYDPISLMTTKIFFTLNNMANVHYLY